MNRKYGMLIVITILALIGGYFGASLVPDAVEGAPRAYLGPTPLYDSGWVLSASGWQTFTHSLDAMPTAWQFLAADDSDGNFPVEAFPRWEKANGDRSGHRVLELCTPGSGSADTIRVYWDVDGIGYSEYEGAYQRGTDYVRLFIFAAEDSNTFGCPYRP